MSVNHKSASAWLRLRHRHLISGLSYLRNAVRIRIGDRVVLCVLALVITLLVAWVCLGPRPEGGAAHWYSRERLFLPLATPAFGPHSCLSRNGRDLVFVMAGGPSSAIKWRCGLRMRDGGDGRGPTNYCECAGGETSYGVRHRGPGVFGRRTVNASGSRMSRNPWNG
ncbi:hypothetical protein EDB84DRAFT_502407 [Lactarius hengduanensis]|nr:hypothetical protein EDB84DRAFT_502407 [Lactarius hengduanensis]